MKSMTACIDIELDKISKNTSYKRSIALAMFNYINSFVLASTSFHDLKRIDELADMLHDLAVANNFTNDEITVLFNMYNIIADYKETSDYRILVDDNTYEIVSDCVYFSRMTNCFE